MSKIIIVIIVIVFMAIFWLLEHDKSRGYIFGCAMLESGLLSMLFGDHFSAEWLEIAAWVLVAIAALIGILTFRISRK